MNSQDLKDKILKIAENNPNFFIKPINDSEILMHIVNISISIIRTRDSSGYNGGGFVQSIIDNDLESAVGKADSDCINALQFFVHIKQYFPKTN